jgi:hypothetical protein
MAHFARIDGGIVREVIVINNVDCGGGEFPMSEVIGQAFIASIGLDGEWRQTSYNGNFRGTYSGISYTFDGDNFIAPEIPSPDPVIEP